MTIAVGKLVADDNFSSFRSIFSFTWIISETNQ